MSTAGTVTQHFRLHVGVDAFGAVSMSFQTCSRSIQAHVARHYNCTTSNAPLTGHQPTGRSMVPASNTTTCMFAEDQWRSKRLFTGQVAPWPESPPSKHCHFECSWQHQHSLSAPAPAACTASSWANPGCTADLAAAAVPYSSDEGLVAILSCHWGADWTWVYTPQTPTLPQAARTVR